MRPFAIFLLAHVGTASASSIPSRTPIGSLAIEPAKAVTHVEMTRVDFLPGQEMPEHMHSVPVVCVVAKGAFAASIGSNSVRTLTVGDTSIEPAGEVVHYFRNLSASAIGQLYCASLAGPDDKQLNVMLAK